MSSNNVWKEFEDQQTGRKYYFNTETKETSWTVPEGYTPQTTQPPESQQIMVEEQKQPQLPPGWEEFEDEKTGKKYYYNKATNETSWVLPQATSHSRQTSEIPVNSVKDSNRLRSFSLHKTTGEKVTMKVNTIDLKTLEKYKRKEKVYSGEMNLVTYAQQNFKPPKRGFFFFFKKKKTESVIKYQKSPLKSTLHTLQNEKWAQKGQEAFHLILAYMGDKKVEKPPIEVAKELLQLALDYVPVRNEIIAQICKQINGNPKEDSVRKGLQLLSMVVSCFPPSSDHLTEAVLYFLQELKKKYKNDISEYALAAEKRLERAMITGARKTLPSDAVIASFQKPEQPKPIFGVTIAEYMEWQAKHYSNETVPKILAVLSEAVERNNGFQTEGIFRLPGNTKEIERLKDNLSCGKLEVDTKDPHVCGSLFKLWLRELAEPIVPDSLYPKCIEVAKDRDACINTVLELPEHHQSVLMFVIQFLSKLCKEEVFHKTKMSVENLAVVFSPNILRNKDKDPRVIMRNSPLEHLFVKNLILSAKEDDE